MNLKQIQILIAAGVVLGGIGLGVYKKQTASWRSETDTAGQKLLGAFDMNEVAQIKIKQTASELNLVKSDIWKVKERWDYPANYTDVSELVRKLADMKSVQTVKIGPSQLGRLDLLEPGKGTNSGTLLELKDKTGKLIKSVLLGKKHSKAGSESDSPFGGGGWPDGRYLWLSATPSTAYVVTEPFANAETKPEAWLAKDFLKVEKISSITVTQTNAAANWKFTRDSDPGEFKLADKSDSEEVDSAKLSSLNSLFSYANYVDVLAPDAKPEDTGLDKPVKAQIQTFDHFTYDFSIGKEATNGNYPLAIKVAADLPKERVAKPDEKPEDKARADKEFKEQNDKLKAKFEQEKTVEKWVYLVNKWTVESLLKDRTNWLAEKKPADGATNAPPTALSAPKFEMGSQAVAPKITNTAPVIKPPANRPRPPTPPLPPPLAIAGATNAAAAKATNNPPSPAPDGQK